LPAFTAFTPGRAVAAQDLQIAGRQRQVRVTRLDVIDVQHDTVMLAVTAQLAPAIIRAERLIPDPGPFARLQERRTCDEFA
jgi:hypothetical protein